MNHPSPLRITGGIFVLIMLLNGTTGRLEATPPPHLVMFLSDDLGRLETSIHGSPDAKTPHLERLASRGMVFDHAYVASPSCCPNRYSLLTGLMPSRHGAHPNHSKPKPGTRFLPPILKSLGYTILSFGKVAHGRSGFEGCDFNSPSPREMHVAVESYFQNNSITGPVCLLVGDRRPHVSWTKDSIYDPDRVELPSCFIDTPETREHWARYLSDITGMDAEMGRIDELARKHLGEDFVFLFTSDHGGQWPRGKWNLYDAGTRVPLVVSWPGRIPAGTRTDAMVSWVDLLPTLIDLAGGQVPDQIDGRSFKSVLLGTTASHRDLIFTTHTGDGIMNVFPMRSVRSSRYKYIHNLTPNAWHTNHSDRHRKDGAGAYWDSWDAAAEENPQARSVIDRYYARDEFEFFDLEADSEERVNRIDEPKLAHEVRQLRQALTDWTRSQGDDLQPHRPPYPRSEPLPNLPASNSKRNRPAANATKR